MGNATWRCCLVSDHRVYGCGQATAAPTGITRPTSISAPTALLFPSCLERRRRARTLHVSASCSHTQVRKARVQGKRTELWRRFWMVFLLLRTQLPALLHLPRRSRCYPPIWSHPRVCATSSPLQMHDPGMRTSNLPRIWMWRSTSSRRTRCCCLWARSRSVARKPNPHARVGGGGGGGGGGSRPSPSDVLPIPSEQAAAPVTVQLWGSAASLSP
ncbi:hypothetical protein K438DRAFT_452219 [Mycena galopus ATCC 62051]|nr:hypothetical protein K438DRAFT_452219 [Mycena galopus ATCC 62051]